MGWMRALWVSFVWMALPAWASAQATCPPEVVGCHAEDADWAYAASLFDTVDFDTGWVPSSSPIQLRFTFHLAGATEVDVGGTPTTSWPAPLEQRVPGREGTGYLSSDYGLEIRLYFRFSVTVAGVSYRFEDEIDIPYIPMDFRAFGETGWDPWLFPPAEPAQVSDRTEPITLVDVGLGSIVPIPGVGGGLRVDSDLQLDTSYQTLRIVLDEGDSADITMNDGFSILPPTGSTANYGAFRDVPVHPEGVLDYVLSLNFVPTLYLEILTSTFTFPVATLPVQLADLMEDVVFDDVVVHVPLPDVDIRPRMVEFGDVLVGETATELLTIENAGEAELEVLFDPAPSPFRAPTELVTVPPMSSRRVEVHFEPTEAGPVGGMLLAATNDPDTPTVLIQLRGNGEEAPMPDAGMAPDMFVAEDAGTPGGLAGGSCGCRTAGSRGPGAPLAFAGLLVGLVAWRRRR